MMKKFMIFFTLSNVLYAQSIIDQYIFASDDIVTLDERKQLFDEHKFKQNYFDKVRLSAEFSKFSDIESEYAIRVYPKPISQVDIEQSTYEIRKQQIENQFYTKSLKNLKLKYNVLLDAYYQKKLLQNLKSMIKLYKAGVKNSQLNVQNSSDIENLSNLKDRLKNLELSYLQKSHQYQNSLAKIKFKVPNVNIKDIEIEFKNRTILSSDKIVELILQNNYFDSKNSTIPSQNDTYERKLLQKKSALKKLKNQITLESVELKYDDSKKINKNLSIGINVEIPIGGDSSYDLVNTKLRLLSLQNRMSANKIDTQHQISKLIEDMTFLHNYNNSIKVHYEDKQIFHSKYVKFEQIEPKFLLNLKKKNFDYEKDMIKIQYQIHKKYLELLYITNTLDGNTTENQIFDTQAGS
jgi:hypothetical protein